MKKSIASLASSSFSNELRPDDLRSGEQGSSLTSHADKHNAISDTVKSDASRAKEKIASNLSRPGTSSKSDPQKLQTESFSHSPSKESKLLDAMQKLLEEKYITWGGYSVFKRKKKRIDQLRIAIEQEKPFGKWLTDPTTLPSKMNCWEVVIYAGFKAQLVSIEDIKKLIVFEEILAEEKDSLNQTLGSIGLVKKMFEDKTRTTRIAPGPTSWDVEYIKNIKIPAGYVVIFGGAGEHVALSLGGERIIELDRDSGTDSGGYITESALSDLFKRKPQYFKKLAWGPFPSL